VNELISFTSALQRPGAASFFSDWALTARDLGELVDQMTQKGLQFAAVAPGDEGYYTALHRALGTYASGLALEDLRELRTRFFAIDKR